MIGNSVLHYQYETELIPVEKTIIVAVRVGWESVGREGTGDEPQLLCPPEESATEKQSTMKPTGLSLQMEFILVHLQRIRQYM